MRKLKLQMQTTINGYIAGPNGEMDWMQWNWDDELKKEVIALTEPVDTILLGRRLAEGFIPTWTQRMASPETADDFGRKMVNTPKIVFSKTLDSVAWENTTLEKGDFVQVIQQLKQQWGKDMIAYGGAQFIASLIKENLIDEYYLFVNPAAIASGMSIFKDLTQTKTFTLIKAKAFTCGIALLCYKPSQTP